MRARLLVVFFSPLVVGLGIACLPDLGADMPPPPMYACGSGVVDLEKGEQCDPGDSGAIGCTGSCQIDCDGGAIDPATSHCYFWIAPQSEIDNGVEACNLLGAHVVSFVDENELQLVVTQTKSLSGVPDAGGTWLALMKLATNDAGVQTYRPTIGVDVPGWSATCVGCFASADGGDADLPLATSTSNPQDCVYWRRSLTAAWFQNSCTLANGNTVPILCEREPPGAFSTACDADAESGDTCIEVPITSSTKRYVLTASSSNFDNAVTACSARGGRLVHFSTSAEREEVIAEVARSVAGGDVWIGLSWSDDAGTWTWSDGTPAPTAFPTPWGDLEPSANIGAATIHIERGRYDTRLARAQADTTATFQALCEVDK